MDVTNNDSEVNNVINLLRIILFFNTVSMVMDILVKFIKVRKIIVAAIIFAFLIQNTKHLYVNIQNMYELPSTLYILFSWMVLKIINFNNWSKENIAATDLMQGLDYGTGMAYSYYYGYLRFILPSMGTLNKGLIEKIENIEDSHNIVIATHKLLILFPSSLYIPPDLKESSYQWMESAITLEEEIRDRAGVKRRIYQNNVYKIYPNGKKINSVPLYVVVEGATPLVTLYEVQKHAHPETRIYQKYRKDIVKNFYNKLKELIDNDPECTGLCELIYYDDYDNNGVKVNVAKVILERLSEINSLEPTSNYRSPNSDQ